MKVVRDVASGEARYLPQRVTRMHAALKTVHEGANLFEMRSFRNVRRVHLLKTYHIARTCGRLWPLDADLTTNLGAQCRRVATVELLTSQSLSSGCCERSRRRDGETMATPITEHHEDFR